MTWLDRHADTPAAGFDGGDKDCGNGLLLLIRRHIDPLDPGALLEVKSTEPSVADDLPSWCRLTGNEMVSAVRKGGEQSFLIRKKSPVVSAERTHAPEAVPTTGVSQTVRTADPTVFIPNSEFRIPNFPVMGVGSWPRPSWLLRSLQEKLSGRLSESEFETAADDAVRLCVVAQERAGVDVVSDGEQRRDNYASFVGGRLDNCQLIPITDLLPYVDDPAHFAEELKALDVPAEQVRHPAVFGKIGRSKPLAVHELKSVQGISTKPVKVALPGPYLLTRTMGLECVSDKAYPDRESLARDLVRVLREEITELLAAGAAIVQLDEPVLTEVVFARPTMGRSFMCGALGAKRGAAEELAFAGRLLRETLAGFPQDRLALHVCRGNWSRDETVALSGPYAPLVPLFQTLPVGTFFLEFATPRAGDLVAIKDLPEGARVGLGVVNQKLDSVETVDEIVERAERAVALFGPHRVGLNPDCGFATFADNPIASAAVAERKLAACAAASAELRRRYGA